MIQIFYKANGEVSLSQRVSELQKLRREDVIWVDLFDPEGDEKRAVEAFLDTEIQSRATAEEIESSSRFKETATALYANTNFLMPGPDEYSMEAVSFTIVGNVLTTLRDVPLRSFTDLQRRLMAMPHLYPSGFWIFAAILDQRVDLDADMIELLSKEIAQYSRRINQKEDINEELLLDINQLQDNTMIVRENIVDKQRLITGIVKSDKFPPELETRFNVLQQDISSLINHSNFAFERLEYLQDTVIGLINLDQNNIMKIFTVLSVFLMTPTLVAGFYGMNVRLPMVNADEPNASVWNWIILTGVMLLSCLVIWIIFKWKKML